MVSYRHGVNNILQENAMIGVVNKVNNGCIDTWDKGNKLVDQIRAATNDYFDNRLVGRLLFRLID